VECGAPWERVVDRQASEYNAKEGAAQSLRCANVISGGTEKVTLGKTDKVIRTDLGWQPTCECHAATRPGITLDPFMGAGTTALVAIQNGRHYIGSELNPEYVAMARQRIAEFDPFQDVEVGDGVTQLSLFTEAL